MTDGLLSSYAGQMIACAAWAVVCGALLLGTLGLIWARTAPQWRTQVNQVTGIRYTGMRSYLIGWGIFWMCAPVITAAVCTINQLGVVVTTELTYHPWIPTAALIVAGIVVAAVVAVVIWRRQSHRPFSYTDEQQMSLKGPNSYMPQSPTTPAHYYGEWSNDGEQVVR